METSLNFTYHQSTGVSFHHFQHLTAFSSSLKDMAEAGR